MFKAAIDNYVEPVELAIGRSWVRISFNTIIDGNGVKAMPGSIPSPTPGSFNNEKMKE